MRKYLKPAMEMEAFDLRDVITTASELPEEEGENDGQVTAPIILEFN